MSIHIQYVNKVILKLKIQKAIGICNRLKPSGFKGRQSSNLFVKLNKVNKEVKVLQNQIYAPFQSAK